MFVVCFFLFSRVRWCVFYWFHRLVPKLVKCIYMYKCAAVRRSLSLSPLFDVNSKLKKFSEFHVIFNSILSNGICVLFLFLSIVTHTHRTSHIQYTFLWTLCVCVCQLLNQANSFGIVKSVFRLFLRVFFIYSIQWLWWWWFFFISLIAFALFVFGCNRMNPNSSHHVWVCQVSDLVYTNLNGIHFPWSSIECIFIIECVFEYGQMEIRGWVLISIAGALKHTVHLPYTLCFAIQELMKWIGRQIWDYECHTH